MINDSFMAWTCETCGVQTALSLVPPGCCPICADERQGIDPGQQQWVDRASLADSQRIEFRAEEGVTTMTLLPGLAINQRAFLIPHSKGNILWECLATVNDEVVQRIKDLGGLTAIAISHPHFYGAMVDWSEAFGGVPIYIHENDRAWVQRGSSAIRFWTGDREQLTDEIYLARLGGHFEGSAGLVWNDGPVPGGTLFGGDAVQVAADSATATFMFSYPKNIPLSREALSDLRNQVERIEFENVFGFATGRQIIGNARALIRASFDRAESAIIRYPMEDHVCKVRESLTVADIPWVPLREGLSMRPLHFEEDGYALQLRLEPGTVIPLHRHTGIVHALNLSGYRRIRGTGEVLGPGDFLFEPTGNVDSWECHGEEPCIIQISLTGRVEYLGRDGKIDSYSDSATAKDSYLKFCERVGVEPDSRLVG